jgi:poly(3-hydroxyalkanoate) synthetase
MRCRALPRQSLQPAFVFAIRDDIRSLAKLAMEADFAAPNQLVDLLNATTVIMSDKNIARFGKLKDILGYRGSIFVETERA